MKKAPKILVLLLSLTTLNACRPEFVEAVCLQGVAYYLHNDSIAPIFNQDGGITVCVNEVE